MTGSFEVMQWTPLNRLFATDNFRGEAATGIGLVADVNMAQKKAQLPAYRALISKK